LANRPGIYAGLGDSKRAHGDIEGALTCYDQTLEADPEHRYTMNQKASALCELARYDDALLLYEQLLALDPGDYFALSGRAQVYLQQDRYEHAIADATRAIGTAPNEELKASDYCTLGIVRQTLGSYELALADFDAMAAADPGSWFAWQQRGLMQSYLEQPDAALDSCNHAIELAPTEASARCQRADVYLALGRRDEALADADCAVELELSAQTLTTRGDILGQLNNYERAIADLTRALELDPGNGWAAQCRAEALWQLGDLENALADFHVAVAYTGEDSDAFRGRGLVYQAMGRLAEARADFRRAIELDADLAGDLGGYLEDKAD
jgi:tetratricopeptide (TPR) repeat protein